MRNIQLTKAHSFNLPEIQDWTDRLPKNQSWDTLPNKQNIVKGKWDGTYHIGLRKPEDIDTIIVHHSGPPEGTLESHAKFHASKWGAGIAYHIAIDQGLIKQVNDLLSFTYHAGGHNTYTVAVMVNADLSKRGITDLERQLLYAAILTVKSLLPIKYILGHNQVNPTACPCINMDQVRSDIIAMEIKSVQAATWQDRKNKCNRINSQINYMDSLIAAGEGSGEARWALQQKELIYKIMDSQKLL